MERYREKLNNSNIIVIVFVDLKKEKKTQKTKLTNSIETFMKLLI